MLWNGLKCEFEDINGEKWIRGDYLRSEQIKFILWMGLNPSVALYAQIKLI